MHDRDPSHESVSAPWTLNQFVNSFCMQAKKPQRQEALAKNNSKSGLLERLIGSHKENRCGINESSKWVAWAAWVAGFSQGLSSMVQGPNSRYALADA